MSHATAGDQDTTASTAAGSPPARRPGSRRPAVRARRARDAHPPLGCIRFLLPALVLLGALVVYPIVYSRRTAASSTPPAPASSDWTTTSRSSATTASSPPSGTTLIWVMVAPTVADRTRTGLRGAHRTGPLGHGVQAASSSCRWPSPCWPRASSSGWSTSQDPARGVAERGRGQRPRHLRRLLRLPGRPAAAERRDRTRRRRLVHHVRRTVDTATPARLAAGRGAARSTLAEAAPAPKAAQPRPDEVAGTVWLDFSQGGGGKPGTIDAGEKAARGHHGAGRQGRQGGGHGHHGEGRHLHASRGRRRRAQLTLPA